MVKVSIIIPIYNAEKYLTNCINSVLAQTFKDFEVLLIDDGSKDDSPTICDKLSKKDCRVRTIHQENMGEAGARNTGIKNATGKYIAFLDADDWWDCKFLENMLDGYEHSELCICKLKKILSDGKFIFDKDYDCNMDEWCWPIVNNYSISCCRCIFLKEIVDKHNILFTLNRKTGADQEFTFKYMMHCNNIAYISSAIYNYNINQSSCMFQKNYNHFDAVRAMQAVVEYASNVCSKEQYDIIAESIEAYKYPYILEFAILTILTAGESPKKVYDYLVKNGFDKLLNNACKMKKHHESKFMASWKKSPKYCLWKFFIRKKIGNILRKIKILED